MSEMSKNVIPLPGQDAKARAQAESDEKRQIFDWADELLKRLGITGKASAAKSIDDLQHVRLDLNDVDIMFAIRAVMFPASGKVAKPFENMSEDKLKRIIKMRFDEMVHYRKLELERGDASTQYDPDICLPDLILAALSEYIDMSEHDGVTYTLWALYSHVYKRFYISPRMVFKSPEPGCGKTNSLDLLSLLCARGVRWDSGTAATMFRAIDADHPTLLLDEIDCLDITGAIEQVFRSGYKKNGVISRYIDGANKYWSAFGVMALAIVEKKLSEALLDRSFVIMLRKSTRTKELRDIQADLEDENLEHINGVVKPIYRQICAWARTNPVLNHSPELPEKLHDRRAVNWRVLISVADCFRETWGKKARDAALAALRIKKQDSAHLMLVSSMRVFPVLTIDRCRCDEFVKALHDLHDAPWNEYCGLQGKGVPHKIKEAKVTQLLSRYEIRPGTVWPSTRKRGDRSKSYRGYMKSWFKDAWSAYCKEEKEEE